MRERAFPQKKAQTDHPVFCGNPEAPKPELVMIGEHFHGTARALNFSSQVTFSGSPEKIFDWIGRKLHAVRLLTP